jgi:flagellar basal-body rod protein FlgC
MLLYFRCMATCLIAVLPLGGCASSPARRVTLLTGVDPSAARVADYLESRGVAVTRVGDAETRVEVDAVCREALIGFMTVARARMDTCAENIANVNTTRDAEGKPAPYRRRYVVVTADGAPDTRVDESPLARRFEPGHPDAGADGFLQCPNVDLAVESLVAQEAAQDYQTAAAVLRRIDPTVVIGG